MKILFSITLTNGDGGSGGRGRGRGRGRGGSGGGAGGYTGNGGAGGLSNGDYPSGQPPIAGNGTGGGGGSGGGGGGRGEGRQRKGVADNTRRRVGVRRTVVQDGQVHLACMCGVAAGGAEEDDRHVGAGVDLEPRRAAVDALVERADGRGAVVEDLEHRTKSIE